MNSLEKEFYESAVSTFLETLELLGCDANHQCQEMGNHNVSWELVDEMKSALFLLDNKHCSFSEEEKELIKSFVKSLELIPSEILGEAIGFDDNLKKMKHSCWNKVRKDANALLKVLR